MADDDVVVEIEKETPAANAAEKVETPATDPVADLKAQFEELQAETAREKEARETAQRQAAAANQQLGATRNELEGARTEITETKLSTVEQGINAAQAASDAAKTEYKAAMEAGDWTKAGDAQEKLADARANLARLTEAKADLEVQKAQPQRTEQRIEAPQTQADPVERMLSQLDAPTATWLRNHPDEARILATNSDPKRAAKLRAAGNDAAGEGYDPSDPKYWSHVEKFLGMTKPNGKANGATPPQRRTSAPVAPVAASGGGVSGGTTVTLTPGEAAAAQDGTHVWGAHDLAAGRIKDKSLIGSAIGIQEMARRKLAMEKEGHYNKIYTQQ